MQLFNGDCLELMNDISDNSVDFICCDPPYGTTSIKWDEVLDFNAMWEQYEIDKEGNYTDSFFDKLKQMYL